MTVRVAARDVIGEIVRNMKGSAEDLYSHSLVPSFYQVHLHATDYERLAPILDRVAADAKQALDAELANLNRVRLADRLLVRRPPRYQAADRAWQIELFRDPDDDVVAGTVKVTSQLTLPRRQGADGAKTKFNVTRKGMSAPPESPRPQEAPGADEGVLALITLLAGGDRVTKPMTTAEFNIGRGGPHSRVDFIVPHDSVSERHARIYRDRSGAFFIENLGRFGTAVDGVAIPSGSTAKLGAIARISLADDSAVLEFRSARATS